MHWSVVPRSFGSSHVCLSLERCQRSYHLSGNAWRLIRTGSRSLLYYSAPLSCFPLGPARSGALDCYRQRDSGGLWPLVISTCHTKPRVSVWCLSHGTLAHGTLVSLHTRNSTKKLAPHWGNGQQNDHHFQQHSRPKAMMHFNMVPELGSSLWCRCIPGVWQSSSIGPFSGPSRPRHMSTLDQTSTAPGQHSLDDKTPLLAVMRNSTKKLVPHWGNGKQKDHHFQQHGRPNTMMHF